MLPKPVKSVLNMSKMSSRKDNGLQPEDTIMRCWQRNGTASRYSDKADLLVTYSDFSRPFPPSRSGHYCEIVVVSRLMRICYWCSSATGSRGQWWGSVLRTTTVSPQQASITSLMIAVAELTGSRSSPSLTRKNPDEIETLVKRVNKAIAADDKEVRQYPHH